MHYTLTDFYIKRSPKTDSWCICVKMHGRTMVWIDTDSYVKARDYYRSYKRHPPQGSCKCQDDTDISNCTYIRYLSGTPEFTWYVFFND